MKLYNVPTGIDQQIEDLIAAQLKLEYAKRSHFDDMARESQMRIDRLQAALNSLSKN